MDGDSEAVAEIMKTLLGHLEKHCDEACSIIPWLDLSRSKNQLKHKLKLVSFPNSHKGIYTI